MSNKEYAFILGYDHLADDILAHIDLALKRPPTLLSQMQATHQVVYAIAEFQQVSDPARHQAGRGSF